MLFHKERKDRSMLVRVLDVDEKPITPLYFLCVLTAIICDVLKTIGYILGCLLLIVLISAGVFTGIIYWKAKPLYNEYMEKAESAVKDATEDTFRYNETSIVYDKNGKVLATLSKDRDTEYLSYDDIPMNTINAFIAIEDRTFWTNPGIDYKGIGRVIYNAVVSKGDDIAGASTITQQLARAVFLSNDVSIDRKLTEMAIAIKLTDKFSKEQIMEFYCNSIYFANGYYGIEAASLGYFGKNTKDLTLGETAYLCAIPNSPTYYDPRVNPDRAYERRDLILDAMYDVGYISKDDMETAKAEAYEVNVASTDIGGYDTTYAVDCAVRCFMQLDGFVFKYHFDTKDEYREYQTAYNNEYESMREELLKGGYKVYTSIDSDLQESLQEAADNYVADKRGQKGFDDFEAAIVATNKEGLVSAIIGGAGDGGFGFNRGYQAYRQPGSSIKPLVVYTPALESGYLPETPVKNIDVATAKKMMSQAAQQGEIFDITKMSGSTITMRYALEQSLNGVAYYLMYDIGTKKTVPYLEKMHFSKILKDDYTLSAALGGLTEGATPVEMAGAYACLLNDGMFNEPTCITSITDRYGKEMYAKADSVKIYSQKTSELIRSMMLGVAKTGTAKSLDWYKSSDTLLYCKTGTTDDKKDNWVCGFAGDNVMAVWIGCDTPKNLGTYGATGAGVLFKECMLRTLELYPEETFPAENTEKAETIVTDSSKDDQILENAIKELEEQESVESEKTPDNQTDAQ